MYPFPRNKDGTDRELGAWVEIGLTYSVDDPRERVSGSSELCECE
jgi:hypothetical protein